MEGFKIDQSIFTAIELQAIFTGLNALDSVAADLRYQTVLYKLSSNARNVSSSNPVSIDLSSHYKNSLAPKISLLQSAIVAQQEVVFTYYKQPRPAAVSLQPYLIVYQWADWYVLGYEKRKEDFRLYKLNRLWALKKTAISFVSRPVPEAALDFQHFYTDQIHAVILFDESALFRLVEEYGPDSFKRRADGRLLFQFPFTNQEYLLQWVTSFGDQAELLEPAALRPILKNKLKQAWIKY